MKINKAVTLNAQSTTSAGEQIAYFNATVSETNSSISMNIQNQALYEANKVQVRQDKQDFDNAVYEVEDSLNVTLEV